ncbi:TetR family transcriptional regulator [Stakelama sp. CBK3Z-3]|uniref:TetR family transcriptional regulator n=1 Tax=Stakelama flava TaxID=2860338 RepID=A0ABS6XGU5_9SPHN|nr:TetR family transcriptional regulator [Stakelama flava]MBW4329397.1 TetR family transcriptional regulator [Stakelama flava]
MASTADDSDQGTARFQAKREAILAAAAEVINEQSAKGMTFADVARRVGLNTTSVTYYFKRKEDLATACFSHTLDYLQSMLESAHEEATPQARVAKLVRLNMARLTRIESGEERDFAILSDLRATDGEAKKFLLSKWRETFRMTRDLWGANPGRAQKDLAGARAHVLLENLFWTPIWLRRYAAEQYGRVEERFMDVFQTGLAPRDAPWSPELLEIAYWEPQPGRESFLLAATRLINELGYRGASVQRIASELKVTKGSFYHHLDAKDDLVIQCYHRSFEAITTAQREADSAGGDHWHRLTGTIATLLDMQFSERMPLLRTTALHGLPNTVRLAMVDESNRIARRFAGTISDGIAEGSIRAVDPLVASQMLMSILNAAFDMHKWAATMPRRRAIAMYASTILFGMFDDRMLDA